jgi:hypothetical protein
MNRLKRKKLKEKTSRLKQIEEAALFTISYFDLFDYPPRTREVHRLLFNQESSLRETGQALDKLKKRGRAENRGDIWYLAGRSSLIKKRAVKERASQRLRKKLKLFGWIFKITPYLRTVAICNSLSFNNAGLNSDIDLFVITRRNRLWISRLISVGLALILGLKKARYRKIDPGKFCLSFYLSEGELSLRSIAQKTDPHLLFWIALLDPLYNQGLFGKFLEANHWALAHFPNLKINHRATKQKPLSLIAFLAEKVFNLLPEDLDDFLFRKQSQRIMGNLPRSAPPGGVVAKKDLFKSHLDGKKDWVNKKLTPEFNRIIKKPEEN